MQLIETDIVNDLVKGRDQRPSRSMENGRHAVFPGDSVMAARCRAFDWAATPLGPVAGWSHSLRTTVGLVLTSRQPMFLWWGPELVQIYNDAYAPSLGTGGRAEHALGAPGRAFWTEIWDAIGPQIEQVMAGGPSTWHEDQYLPIERNGRLEDVWWTYSYSPVRDDDGTIAATLVVCQETTARVLAARASEAAAAQLAAERARLADIIRIAPAFMAVLRGPTHVVELTNAGYDALVGHRDVRGRTVAEALPETAAQGFVALLDRVLATGEPYIGREVPYRRPDAAGVEDERFVDFVYQAVVEAGGTRAGVFVHGVDVTNQVRARREVERLLAESERARREAVTAHADAEAARRDAEAARREAEQARADAETANRSKSEFLAVMSHELRTPLNAIGGYAELMEMGIRGPITAQQREDLRRLQASQRHLLGLINEVLNYARLETGSVQYDLGDVRARDALAGAEALVVPQVHAKGLTLTVPACDPELAVRADAEKLRQILVNLLSNAVKFTARGGRIELTCAAAGAQVAFTVRDTGVGIAADQLGRIFDPFVQVRADFTRPHDGAGLGLAISRDLARGMDGDLTVTSTPGVGSAFTLVLPRA